MGGRAAWPLLKYHAGQELNIPGQGGGVEWVYFYLHCPDEETEASRTLGNVPNDNGQEKMAKHLLFTPLQVAPPAPRQSLYLAEIILSAAWSPHKSRDPV